LRDLQIEIEAAAQNGQVDHRPVGELGQTKREVIHGNARRRHLHVQKRSLSLVDPGAAAVRRYVQRQP
jgi:hypothetical protein